MLPGAQLMTPWPWRRFPQQREKAHSCLQTQSCRHAAAQRRRPLLAPERALPALALVHPCTSWSCSVTALMPRRQACLGAQELPKRVFSTNMHFMPLPTKGRLCSSAGQKAAAVTHRQTCSASPPSPVEVWLLREVRRLAAATQAAGHLAGCSTELIASRAATQHLQLVALQPRCFTCASQHPVCSQITISLLSGAACQHASQMMPSGDK